MVIVLLVIWVALALMGVVLCAAASRFDQEIELDARLSRPVSPSPH